MHFKVTSFLMSLCILYMCFYTISLNSPSVSKPTSFKVVCVSQGHVFWLSSLQNSIQNIHDFSFLDLPLPVVIFGLSSTVLCVSMHLCEWVLGFFNGFKASVSAMMGRCLCSFPPPPPSLLLAGQFLVPPSVAVGCSYQTCPAVRLSPCPALSHKKHRTKEVVHDALFIFTNLEIWLLPTNVYQLYIPAKAGMSHFYIAHRKF